MGEGGSRRLLSRNFREAEGVEHAADLSCCSRAEGGCTIIPEILTTESVCTALSWMDGEREAGYGCLCTW